MGILKKLFACSIAVMAIVTVLPAATASAGSTRKCYDYFPSEKDFKKQMNASRADAGVGKLHLDPQLSKVAKKHAREMRDSDKLYHTSNSNLSHRVTHWNILGENVGVGGGVQSLEKAFMNSPEHRSNILLPKFEYVGVGVVNLHDRMWVTVIFESASNPGTPLRMPSC